MDGNDKRLFVKAQRLTRNKYYEMKETTSKI